MGEPIASLSDSDEPRFLAIAPAELAKLQLSARDWFFKLINPEESHDLLEGVWKHINQRLAPFKNATDTHDVGALLTTGNQAIEALGSRIRLDLVGLLKGAPQRQHFYYQHAPLFKMLGGWLTGVTSIAYAWRRVGGLLLQTHAKMVGHGYPARSQSCLFDQMAQRAGVHTSDVFTSHFSHDPGIQDEAFELPVFLLGIACFPSALYGETLGINLAMCGYIDQLNSLHEADGPFFGQPGTEQYRPLALAAIEHYLLQTGPEARASIAAGHACALELIKAAEERLRVELMDETRFGNLAAMQALINKLGPHGCGYHKRGQLAEQPIDHWLKPETFCPQATVSALADSRYVRAGQPGKSAFMRLISEPKGKMFGIFSEPDIQVVRTWIAELDGQDNKPAAPRMPVNQPSPCVALCEKALSKARQQALNTYSGLSLQQLYPLFLHIDQAPDALPVARRFAERWLTLHQRAVQQDGLPFSPYSHQKLDQWLATQHARQVESYRPLTEAPEETREDIIADATRLAPLTLIDGAWLRSVVAPASVTRPIGALLYRTLIDELGQGDTALHHGNIYQDLLASMGVTVGDFTEQPFAASALFDNDSLQVPVFWLAVSLFPQSFQPEILGLNLAMELSGVGGEYRRSADVLRHYGFNSLFTDLHNTIDNVVSGHTAWAIEAIKQHLDDIAQNGGTTELARHWQRVWVGYRALSPPAEPFLNALRAFTRRTLNTIIQRQDAS